ncbi:hypothetical protein [Micromonospora saelicesensis]|uniref:hypothetical protein n=1 Tax=Micromonospora saelicesensis TaxID=285676 RepID=UPI0011BEA981|nr:hypothetical protein [Micromonospora saelicesensis]
MDSDDGASFRTVVRMVEGATEPARSRGVGRVPLFAAISVVVLLALAIAGLVGFVGWLILMNPQTKIVTTSPKDALDLAKVALAVAGGIGGAGALVVGFRKQLAAEAEHLRNEREHRRGDRAEQREVYRSLNERFHQAVILLGNKESPAVRLSGVYSLASLAEDWSLGRQQCIDVLCAYIRLPVAPDIEDSGEREVRRTVFSVIREHLLEDAPQRWDGLRFDMSGANLDGVNLDNIKLQRSTLDFSRAKLLGGQISLKGLALEGGGINFRQAQFAAGEIDISGVFVDRGRLSFEDAEFLGSGLVCNHGMILTGQISFAGCRISGSRLNLGRLSPIATDDRRKPAPLTFDDAIIEDGQVYLGALDYEHLEGVSEGVEQGQSNLIRGSRRDGCWVTLRHILLNGGLVSFREARFNSGVISLENAVLAGGEVTFAMARFVASEINFAGVKFKGSTVDFEYAHFQGSRGEGSEREAAQWIRRLEKLPVVERDMVWDPHPVAALQLNSAEFWDGVLVLDHCSIDDAVLDFVGVDFRGGRVTLARANCVRAVVNLWNSRFNYSSVTEIVLPDDKFLTVLWSDYYEGPLARIGIPEKVSVLEVSASD